MLAFSTSAMTFVGPSPVFSAKNSSTLAETQTDPEEDEVVDTAEATATAEVFGFLATTLEAPFPFLFF
jgi:hypothetical protein